MFWQAISRNKRKDGVFYDFMADKRGTVYHKQIEYRNGMLFMRMKSRKVYSIL